MNNKDYGKQLCLLSVDLGTTSMKFGLFDTDGKLAGCSIQEYKLNSPKPDWLEMEEKLYLKAFVSGIKELKNKTRVPLKNWKSICFSSQGQTFFPLDKKGNTLYPAIVWLDGRAKKEAQKIAKIFSRREYYKNTGTYYVSPLLSGSKILWLREHMPQITKKCYKYLMLKDYFIYRLTGKCVSDPSILGSSGMFDIDKKVFWKNMLDFIGVREDQFSRVSEPWEIAGEVTGNAARMYGLSEGMKVLTGGMDQSFSALGAGNYKEGIVTGNIGTCLSLYTTTNKRVLDPEFRLLSGRHIVEDKFFLLPFVQTAGMVLKWFRDNFAQGQTYDKLSKMAEEIPPGSDGLVMLPHLTGASCPQANMDAKGVFYGIALVHTKAHMIRAIMESVAFAMLENIKVLKQLKVEVSKITAIGGGAKSKLWLQIIADTVGLEVIKPEMEESALLGGAILQAVTLGIKRNISEAAGDFCRIKDKILPNTRNHNIYRQGYKKYLDLYTKLYSK